jgi:serine/threonine protein kinase
MRIPNPFLRTEYLIKEPLGEGLTSHVYKAIRRHRRLNIEQTVALKVLHSKDEVRTLKNEIKILSQIRSAHCVQLLGWEELAVGPAIVLEYLEGLSLAELSAMIPLSTAMIDEILAQVQDGLRDLDKYKICHGDLSSRNIFISTSGVVKLLDFGFSGVTQGGSLYGTPQILAPEVWLGQPISLAADLFSLGLIKVDLEERTIVSDRTRDHWKQRSLDKIGQSPLLHSDPAKREFLPLESHKHSREQLASQVTQAFEYKSTSSTQKLDSTNLENLKIRRPKVPWVLSAGIFFFFHQLQPASLPLVATVERVSTRMKLDIRSHRWAALSLYEKSGEKHLELKRRGYAPVIFRDLKAGTYEIHWKSSDGKGIIPISLERNQRIRLR